MALLQAEVNVKFSSFSIFFFYNIFSSASRKENPFKLYSAIAHNVWQGRKKEGRKEGSFGRLFFFFFNKRNCKREPSNTESYARSARQHMPIHDGHGFLTQIRTNRVRLNHTTASPGTEGVSKTCFLEISSSQAA